MYPSVFTLVSTSPIKSIRFEFEWLNALYALYLINIGESIARKSRLCFGSKMK